MAARMANSVAVSETWRPSTTTALGGPAAGAPGARTVVARTVVARNVVARTVVARTVVARGSAVRGPAARGPAGRRPAAGGSARTSRTVATSWRGLNGRVSHRRAPAVPVR